MTSYHSEFFNCFRIDLKTKESTLVCPQTVMDVYQLASLFLFSVLAFHSTCQPPDDAANNMKQHLRRKRYIVFPEGSTFSVSNKKVYV
jgi:hypothetical protein